ncbi:MAG: PQQ-binding-like beta-propeller repeat protein [Phycisphaerae bacterium]
MRIRCTLLLTLVLLMAAVAAPEAAAAPAAESDDAEAAARAVRRDTGVRGGLVVHLGSGDGRLTAALGAGKGWLVQGLARSDANLAAARAHIRSLGRYGRVSVARFEGSRLPYVDGLVNLFVTEGLGGVPMAEVRRVLAPGGVAWVAGQTRVQPRPEAFDEWTHYLHDPSNNAVAHDAAVGPPRHFQWVGSPRWSRHHDRMASLSAMVTAGGRVFYIMDEGPRSSIMLPAEWKLIARDAASGVVLWKRDIPEWWTHLWPLKSGPAQLPRRLVAVGDTVYVTLGLGAPVVALDAATGETRRTYEGTEDTEELLLADGVLYLQVNPSPEAVEYEPVERNIGAARDRVILDHGWDKGPRRLLAVEAATGRLRWQTEARITPLSLAVADGRVVFHEGESLVCLAAADGKEVWRTAVPSRPHSMPRCFGKSSERNLKGKDLGPTDLARSFGATLVVADGVVLFTCGDGTVSAVRAADGTMLWSGEIPPSGHYCPEDLLVAGGMVWTGDTAWGRKDTGVFVGRDIHTGEVASRFTPDVSPEWMHQRCYRSKATDRYLLPSRMGIEFVDWQAKHWTIHHWVRGGCLYGIVPANGLVYAPPHDCACYLQSKLYGFCALAAATPSRRVPAEVDDAKRLQRGPQADGRLSAPRAVPRPALSGRAPGTEKRTAGQDPPWHTRALAAPREAAAAPIRNPQSAIRNDDWPTYRHDAARSGRAPAAVPADLKPAWTADLGGRLCAPTVAGGRVYVARVDAHAVHCLDARDGRTLWSFTAGGRVDSPPTLWRGRALFGAADGCIYCLRAEDGALVWRFRAAPDDRRMTAFEQVESVWPVPGSVLVRGGEGKDGGAVVYAVAGRSMFTDGGLRLVRLDAATGRKISETVLDDRDPASGKTLQDLMEQRGKRMPVALPDVLSCDGRHVYMRAQRFDLQGRREHLDRTPVAEQRGEGVHLFSPTGFLDGTWFHRSYWIWGRDHAEGAGGWPQAGRHAPAGRILVVDDETVYGYGRQPAYYQWTTPLKYHLFAAHKTPPEMEQKKQRPRKQRRPTYRWSRAVPLHVRAMVLAGEALLVAGPPNVADEEEAFEKWRSQGVRERLRRQRDALRGAEGARLWVVSAADGAKRAEVRLEAVPVWDGMAVARGRVVLADADGRVLCLAGE